MMTDAQLSALIVRLRDDLRPRTDATALTLLMAASELVLQSDAPETDATALRDATSRCVLGLLGVKDANIEKLRMMLETGQEAVGHA